MSPPSITEKPIEKATLEVVYKDGTREVVTLQAEEWSSIRGKFHLEAYDDPPDVTEFGRTGYFAAVGDPALRVDLRGGVATYTRGDTP